MTSEKRIGKRVGFYQGFAANVTAMDGTWSVPCRVEDISHTGAKLNILGRINPRMDTEEFFIVMSGNGRVSRRGKIIWKKHSRIGIEFLQTK